MARNLEQVLAKLPPKRRERVERRAVELATLKGLRQGIKRTQKELASSLGVGQDTISRLEQRSDMLISTLKRYVEAMGGRLDLIARFPNRPPVMIDRIAELAPGHRSSHGKPIARVVPVEKGSPEDLLLEIGMVLKDAGVTRKQALTALKAAGKIVYG
jgi:transcriptional regulator with XRE-family HTH domain